MSEDTIREYQEAIGNLETATRQVERLVSEVTKGSERLDKLERSRIAAALSFKTSEAEEKLK